MAADERSEEFVNVRQLKRNWIVPIVGAILFCVGVYANRYGAAHERPYQTNDWEPIGALMMWFGGWAALLVGLRDAFRHERHASLFASNTGIQINEEPAIKVEDVVEVRHLPQMIRKARDIVDLKIRTGPRWWQRRTVKLGLMPQDAARFLALIGSRAGERRSKFTLAIRYRWRFLASVLILGLPWLPAAISGERNMEDALAMLFFGFFFGMVPLGAILGVALGALRGRVVVGAEGFTTHWYGWRRYHAFETVKHIEPVRQAGTEGKIVDILIWDHDGKSKRLVARNAPDTHSQNGAEGRALAATLQEAFNRWVHAPDVAKASTQLERGGRTGKAWLAGIDQLVRGGQGNYRVASISEDTLAEVTKASDATTEARVGAAAALLRLKNGQHRTTVRIAAEACAEPMTRQALLDLVEAEENETKMEAALERVRHVR